MGLLPAMIQYFVASFTNKQIGMLLQKKITPFWVALEPQMWSFHLSSLDLSLELVQPKDEKVFYSLRRPKLENLIIVPAGDLLMLRHANWLVLFPVHLALASFWLWLWSFVFSLIFLVSEASFKHWYDAPTMDARWGNRLHCMAENQLPLPKF